MDEHKPTITVWTYYNGNGWSPTEFDNETEAAEFIKRGGNNSGPMRMTREFDLVPCLVSIPDTETE